MKIIMLGTGNALATECYNTCFILNDGRKNFMIDGGGGSTVLRQIKHAGFTLQDIKNIFVTHSHIDHILGIIWVMRIISQLMKKGEYDGEVNIYSHDEVIELLHDLTKKLLLPYQFSYIGKRIIMHKISDIETRNIIGHDVKFFDIHSERTKQFGFVFMLDENHKLTFCGDEPCNKLCECHVNGSEWLIHEAFCLYSQVDIFSPYEKHHSTVKDACELAQRSGVKKVLLCHTEDSNIARRKELYTDEGKKYFSGEIFVPNDLEVLQL